MALQELGKNHGSNLTTSNDSNLELESLFRLVLVVVLRLALEEVVESFSAEERLQHDDISNHV